MPQAPLFVYEGHLVAPICSVAWSPNAKRIASAGLDGVRVWEALSGDIVAYYRGHSGKVNAAAWSPDGLLIASVGDNDYTLQVWESSSGHRRLSCDREWRGNTTVGQGGSKLSVTWSPDGQYIATSAGGTGNSEHIGVQIWNSATGEPVLSYREHYPRLDVYNSDVTAVSWSPFGSTLASGGVNGDLRVWSGTSGQTQWSAKQQGDITSVAWSPSGSYIAVARYNVAEVWRGNVYDARPGESPSPVVVYRGHGTAYTASVAWSPNDTRVASAGLDGVHVWEAASGRTIQQYPGVYDASDSRSLGVRETNGPGSVAWSPDGRYIAIGGRDNTVQVWPAP